MPHVFCVVVLALLAVPDRDPGPALSPNAYDLAARILVAPNPEGGGQWVVQVRFTSLGPTGSPAFQYQVFRSLVSPSVRAQPVAINAPTSIPALSPKRSEERHHTVQLTRGVSYIFRISYTPTLSDANNDNHQVEYRFTVPN